MEDTAMLYAFIDRIEVHEATGGRTIYRQQVIDIHFNFIGHFYPPAETITCLLYTSRCV